MYKGKKDYDLIPSAFAFDTYEDAVKFAEPLLRNEYVVMISREDEFYTVSALFADRGDRSDTVFMRRDEFEDMFFSKDEDDTPDIASLKNDAAWQEGFNRGEELLGSDDKVGE